MINIKVMTDSAFQKCKKNAEALAKEMIAHPTDASWLSDFIGAEPFQEKNYQIEEFELIEPKPETKNEDEMKNGIAMYNAFKNLPKHILYDLHFWNWVAFSFGYKAALVTIPPSAVENTWFGKNNGKADSRRSVMLQVLARSFERVRMSILPNENNPYLLTEFLFNNERCYRNMVFRNISDIPAVAHSFIRAEMEVSAKYGIALDGVKNSNIMKGISQMGSIKLLDAIPEDELYPLVLEIAEKAVSE